MEAAAETVRQLTRSTLPELPHQLAQSPDYKCRLIVDEGKRFEERIDSRLQYMTMVNEGDRGVLFTRGYYDIRPEQRPVPREVNVLSRGSGKKLSLSDYAKKKSGAATSTSPSDPPTPSNQKKPNDRPTASTDARSSDESKNPRDARKIDSSKSSVAESHGPGKSKPSATDTVVVDTTLPAKPSFLPDRPPDPERRKRPADPDDGARPPKRPRPSDVGRAPESSSRDDTLRRKNQESSSSRNLTPLKDPKQTNSTPLPNGRSMLKSTTSQSRTGSPPRARGNSMNGVRPSTTTTQQGGRSASRTEGPSKSNVPPLLSPLHLDLQDDANESGARKAQKKRELDAGKSSKQRNLDSQGHARAPRSPLKLPPLLSPTLPPEIEAELERRKKLSPRPPDGRDRDRDRDRDGERKIRLEPLDDAQEARIRRSLTVTLKVPKRLRNRFSALIKLSASRKEPRSLDRPASSGGPSHAEKRPAGSGEIPPESMASKRPRASDVSGSSKPLVPPSTPSKKGATTMSRVSSTNSLAHTPGEAALGTPSVPGSSERTINGPESHPKGTAAKVASLREKEAALRALGKKLKHDGDPLLKGRQDQTNGNARSAESNAKLGFVLILESTLAFMLGFYVQDLHRSLNSKAADPNIWASLLPLLEFIQKDMRRFEVSTKQSMRPMHAVATLLQVIAFDEIVKAHATQDNPKEVTVPDLLRIRRSRDRLIPQLRDLNASIDSSLRAQVTIWTTLEDIAEAVLGILRRWCSDEGIEYTAQLNLREAGVRNITSIMNHH